jgi:hypothetical protein
MTAHETVQYSTPVVVDGLGRNKKEGWSKNDRGLMPLSAKVATGGPSLFNVIEARRTLDGKIRGGDLIVCRVNGTSDVYVVGSVVSGKAGELSLSGLSTTVGRDVALGRAYHDRLLEQQVWLFDGAAAAYVKTSAPPT